MQVNKLHGDNKEGSIHRYEATYTDKNGQEQKIELDIANDNKTPEETLQKATEELTKLIEEAGGEQ